MQCRWSNEKVLSVWADLCYSSFLFITLVMSIINNCHKFNNECLWLSSVSLVIEELHKGGQQRIIWLFHIRTHRVVVGKHHILNLLRNLFSIPQLLQKNSGCFPVDSTSDPVPASLQFCSQFKHLFKSVNATLCSVEKEMSVWSSTPAYGPGWWYLQPRSIKSSFIVLMCSADMGPGSHELVCAAAVRWRLH